MKSLFSSCHSSCYSILIECQSCQDIRSTFSAFSSLSWTGDLVLKPRLSFLGKYSSCFQISKSWPKIWVTTLSSIVKNKSGVSMTDWVNWEALWKGDLTKHSPLSTGVFETMSCPQVSWIRLLFHRLHRLLPQLLHCLSESSMFLITRVLPTQVTNQSNKGILMAVQKIWHLSC